ncbi:MAG: type III-B CRISPR-associated protein Cas10/Cmr2 [Methanotrichaceae archaeon]
MIAYLYVLSIGPVQDFIAAARRTRDLWFGSHLLSEISKAAANKISESGELIFPALKVGSKELDPDPNPGAYNVGNIILAKLHEGINPAELDIDVQDSACKEWMRYANGAKSLAGEFIREDIWEKQVNDIIEFYSAWVPLNGDDPEIYQEAHKKLMRLLGGRKSIRNFDLPYEDPDKYFGIPKSSLDGARESVLKKDDEIPRELAIKMRLQNGEQLCAIGLTKRLGWRKDESKIEQPPIELEAFPSVVRVALDPWIRGVKKSDVGADELLNRIKGICKKNQTIAQGAGRLYNGNRRYPDFPFDGQILYLPRIAGMINDGKNSSSPKENIHHKWRGWEVNISKEDIEDLKLIKGFVERLQKKGETEKGEKCFGLGEPQRYYAILIADGDRMGKLIAARKTSKEHHDFSAKLAKFAKIARNVVEKNHGCMVYSGGDDVLAFLPLDYCLQVARKLHDIFGNLLKSYLDEEGNCATLSVGIAIGHSMEPLEDILSFGKEAEKAAKKGSKSSNLNDERNGLAVHIHPRSGAPIKVGEQWKPKDKKGLDKRLLNWAEMHSNNLLPDSIAYEMHELAEDYRDWGTSSNDEKEKLRDLIAADALRLIYRKKGKAKLPILTKDDIKDMLNELDPYEAINKLASELILARRIAAAMKQAKGRKSQSNEEPYQEAC